MSVHHGRVGRIQRAMGLGAVAAGSLLIMSACASGTSTTTTDTTMESKYGFPAPEQVEGSPITILVDADRSAIAEAFAADNPDIKVNIETYDGNAGGTNSFQTKISLADAAGSGWPDVVWSGQVNDASWAAHEQKGVQAWAAALDEGVIDQGWLDGYTAGAEDPVTVDGHIYGARDNLAPVVFWYNQALFDQFGYDHPDHLGGVPGAGRQACRRAPRVHPRLDR